LAAALHSSGPQKNEEATVRTLAHIIAVLLTTAPAFAELHVQVSAPAPPRIVVHAPAPPRAHVVVHAPRPRGVVIHAPAVHVRPPRIHFVAAPPLVVVRPGIRVVADADQEIFFTQGYYWTCSSDGTWWRSRHHRGRWSVASSRAVPGTLVHMPRGHYRHYHPHGKASVRWEKRHHHHRHWRADRHGKSGRGRRG
jgi:hypothetical protein